MSEEGRPGNEALRINVALGKEALQSSVDAVSRSQDPAEDARGAISGRLSGGYGFHTAEQASPWWRVDLGGPHLLQEIVIHNRLDAPELRERAVPLEIALSDDGTAWRLVHVQYEVFGGADGHPLRWVATGREQARFVKLTVPKVTYFHLDQVEVYGRPWKAPESPREAEGVPFVDRLRRALFEE